MKRKIVIMCLAIVMALSLTGCLGEEYKVTMHTDGTGTMSLTFMFDAQMYKTLVEASKEENNGKAPEILKGFKQSKREYNDNVYACFEKTADFKSASELQEILTDEEKLFKKFSINEEQSELGTGADSSLDEATFRKAKVTADSFEAYMPGLGEGAAGYMCVLFSIGFDKEILYTNGTLSEDKKTASWEFTDIENGAILQASTIGESSFTADKSVPVIKGIQNKKYYKKTVIINADDDKGIKRLTCDGAAIKNKEEIDEEGRHVVIAEDFAGNKVKKVFYIDYTSPTVKGVKDYSTYRSKRTIKFYDKSGIKSATLNGKKIKSGKKVSKPGSYRLKVKDKVGNITDIVFKIAKNS